MPLQPLTDFVQITRPSDTKKGGILLPEHYFEATVVSIGPEVRGLVTGDTVLVVSGAPVEVLDKCWTALVRVGGILAKKVDGICDIVGTSSEDAANKTEPTDLNCVAEITR